MYKENKIKKILVILMLGAGFVTVAFADSPDCTDHTNTTQCCIDLHTMNNAIMNSPSHSIPGAFGNDVTYLSPHLINDGSSGTVCSTSAYFTTSVDANHHGTCEWTKGVPYNPQCYK